MYIARYKTEICQHDKLIIWIYVNEPHFAGGMLSPTPSSTISGVAGSSWRGVGVTRISFHFGVGAHLPKFEAGAVCVGMGLSQSPR